MIKTSIFEGILFTIGSFDDHGKHRGDVDAHAPACGEWHGFRRRR